MKNYICIAVFTVLSAAFAQNQNRVPNQPQPEVTPPSTATPTATPAAPATSVTPGTPAIHATPGVPKTARERALEGVNNALTEWRLEDLPPAVQKTVTEQSAGQPIADIDRETRTGRVIWEVEFEKAGRNSEIHVADDGTLIPERGASIARTTDTAGRPIVPGSQPTASGNPAGTQTGRSTGAMLGTQWEDLPPAVQQKAMQFGGQEKVADIDRENMRGRAAYEIEFRREGRNLEIYFGEDGTILESNDPAAVRAQTAQSAAQAPHTAQPAQTPEAAQTPQSPQSPQGAQGTGPRAARTPRSQQTTQGTTPPTPPPTQPGQPRSQQGQQSQSGQPQATPPQPAPQSPLNQDPVLPQ